MPKKWTWDQMIEEFRALGGVADNVCQKEGDVGLGIFPLDPSKPVTVETPKNLLIDIRDLTFDDGKLRVKKDAAGIGERERKFFEMYEDYFSWGLAGRADCQAFFDGLDALPEGPRNVLSNDFNLKEFLSATDKERVQNRFVRTRMIRSQGKRVIMPVVDLINHGVDGKPYDTKNGVIVTGTFAKEVLARYNTTDPYGIFITWGFASPEQVAFSLPMRLSLGTRRLHVQRNISEKRKLGAVQAPTVKVENDTIQISHLMLGHFKFPRIAKGIFYRLMQDQNIERTVAEDLFDRIQNFNRTRFLKLNAALGDHAGQPISILRKMTEYQLMAMSQYAGVRQL